MEAQRLESPRIGAMRGMPRDHLHLYKQESLTGMCCASSEAEV
jgi:hypothetical protein